VRQYAGIPISPPGGWTSERVLIQVLVDGVPAALALVALGLIVAVVQQEAQAGAMTPRVRRLLFWIPRAAALLFAAFVSLFALDVFGAGYDLWGTLLALVIHLIPVFVLLAAIATAWRWPWVGAAALIGWAAWYVATFRGFVLSVYVGLALLPLLLGVLFLLNWRYRVELRGSSTGRGQVGPAGGPPPGRVAAGSTGAAPA
jgi:hypothetical protein